MLLRAFAFLLLDAAHNTSSRRTNDIERSIRIFKIALRASRCALDNHDLDLAFKLLESCSKSVSTCDEAIPAIRVADGEHNDEEVLVTQLTREYYLCRMIHASKSGRLDLAEHFFLKANITGDTENSDRIETAADFCYEIGRSLQSQKRVESALSWLERAYQCLNIGDAMCSSPKSEDLRLAIVASFIEMLLESSNTDNMKRAWDLLTSLEQDHGLGNRMAVLTMQLNVLTRADQVDISAASGVVSRMIRSSILTDQTYRT
jgi:hypothetical protein